MTTLLADVFALYLKTKNFHWHMSGPYFRDYHLLLDDQANQIYATTDPIAERARKIGGKTLRSAGHITKLQRIADNDADFVTPGDMLAELREDNLALAGYMRETHSLCDEYGDVATASLLEKLDRRSRAARVVPVRVGTPRRDEAHWPLGLNAHAHWQHEVNSHRALTTIKQSESTAKYSRP